MDAAPAGSFLSGLRSLVHSRMEPPDFDALLAELLDRVRKVIEADTAAILLLDEESRMLVARAASGIEEEIYQGVRVPVGRGFAGRIAAERRPVILDTVSPETVTNPILWERGIRSMLGVPLESGSSLLGVLHVGRLSDRPFIEDEAELLGVVAERVVLALQAGLLKAERAASAILERGFVPAALPTVAGFEFGARYFPAVERGVGGDWYDVFQLPSGEVWISVGDVVGHGLPAAVVMGRLRTMIRSHAFRGARPDVVLQLTDQEFQFFDPKEMATATVVALSPSSGEIHICSAGHPPPILALPEGLTQVVEMEAEPPLGVAPDLPRSTAAVLFPLGALLALYTDGLIERRGESLSVGLERLCGVLTADGPEDVCRRVMFRLVGRTSPEDDIALVTARRVPTATG